MSKETLSILELSNRLDDLHTDLSIAEETVNAIESSLLEKILSADQVIWALIGVRRSIEQAAKETAELNNATMGIFSTLREVVERSEL